MTGSKYSSGAPMCACGNPIIQRSGPGRPRKSCGPDCAGRAKVEARESDSRPRQYIRVGIRSFECIQCRTKFDSPRAKKYCTSYCKERAKHLKQQPEARSRGPLPRLQPRACAGCAQLFKPKRAMYGTYCSRDCAFRHLSEVRRSTAQPAPGLRCLVYFKTCANCGGSWTSRYKLSPVCSAECGRALLSAKERARNIAKCGSKGAKACRCCGKEFMPAYGDKRSAFCGAACARRFIRRNAPKDARKRARHYGVEYEYVNRIKVFNRDGWRCQICGKSTPRKSMGTLKTNAPELDHRVPISKGGGHTYANVQCSCRQCNGSKSNLNSAGQLPLLPVEPMRGGRGIKV